MLKILFLLLLLYFSIPNDEYKIELKLTDIEKIYIEDFNTAGRNRVINIESFINDLSNLENKYAVKYMAKQHIILEYRNGETIKLRTDGRNIGPTPQGFFFSKVDLLEKYYSE